MTLEEDPDAIWMTGPPPRLPFARTGMRWRVAISLLVPLVVGLGMVAYFSAWADARSPLENGAILLAAAAGVALVLLAVWTSRGRSRRRASR